MKVLVSSLVICCTLTVTAQRNYSDQEIKRLAYLGRLWGMLHYFHPKMGTGEIATDSLILSPTASLIADPSARNFERCVKEMLSRLNDPSTQLIEKPVDRSALLFTPDPYKSAVHKLPNGVLYVAFPTAAANYDDLYSMTGLQPAQWDSAKAIILDARNISNPLGDGIGAFQYNFPAFVSKLLGGTQLPDVYDRSIYYNGFVTQGNRPLSYNYGGWKTKSSGRLSHLQTEKKSFQKPLLVIFNMVGADLDVEVANFFQSMKAAGLCKLIFEGNEAEYPSGEMITINLADSLIANLRVSDYLVGNDHLVPRPDWCIDRITDTSLSGIFVNRCVQLLLENNSETLADKKTNLSLRFVPPMPGRYDDEKFPSPEKRLFAIYNWWNAIEYFFPHKHLIGRNWDNVLAEYVPLLLQANDPLAYNIVLMNMVSEINDSHAYLSNLDWKPTFFWKKHQHYPPLQVMFIENKLWVVDKGHDSLQDMTNVRRWDEIIEIDGRTIDKIKEDWPFLKYGKESNFLGVLPNAILTGELNSTIRLGLKRGEEKFIVDLKRTGSHSFDYKWLLFQDKHSAFQLLEKEIGYIKMGQVTPNEMDSAMRTLHNTKAIIFDLRDIISTQAPASLIACNTRTVSMNERPYVTAGYIKGGAFDSASLLSYSTIKPADSGNCYKGKIIILVNEMDLSQGEFTAMKLQAASTNATVIGSQTAGADGAITQTVFPGGYLAQFTSTSVKYPDGRQTQRIGVKIDIEVKPTIAGFKAGKDEVLLRAIEFIKKGK